MPDDRIRYDVLAQQALRGVVRQVLVDVAKTGLPGEHHFFISFDTLAPGVRISPRLRAQHPEEMTIVLQHQFWDLKITERAFEVGLSFGGVSEHLVVPFEAIKGFFDPSVQFGLQFEALDQAREKATEVTGAPVPAVKEDLQTDASPAMSAPQEATSEGEAGGDGRDGPPGGGEVVRLDRFRKK